MMLALAHWWYWWLIPTVMLALLSWATRSWLPVGIGVPIVLIVFFIVAMGIISDQLR
jgi:hypothetical protein